MGDKETKKKGSKSLGESYNTVADNSLLTAKQQADALRAENERLETEVAATKEAYQAAQNATQEQYKQNAQKYTDFYDVVNTKAGQDIQQAEAEAAAQKKADLDAAKWTGLTELASSVANLIGVGSGNAVSQQYRTYSQDWMRKADLDAREHRARIQNLRERQRSIQLQMNQLKLGEAQRQLEMQSKLNDQRYNQDIAAAERRSKNAMAANQLEAEARTKADDIRLKGAIAEAEMGLKEDAHDIQREAHELTRRGQDISARQHREDRISREKTQAAALAAKMEAQGYDNIDGHWVPNEAKMKTIALSKSTKSSSSNKGVNYDVVINGSKAKVNMDKESYSEAILSGAEEIKKDLMDKAGVSSWGELLNLVGREKIKDKNGKKVSNPLYGADAELIAALEHTGNDKSDLETIKRYVREHKSDFPNFNAHLVYMSDRDFDYEDSESYAKRASGDSVRLYGQAEAGEGANNDNKEPSWEDDYPE